MTSIADKRSRHFFISRYTGAYDLMGQTINVSLKGAALVAVIGGQPPMDLVPALSGDLTLKQVQAVSIHFVKDDKGSAAGFELRQRGYGFDGGAEAVIG